MTNALLNRALIAPAAISLSIIVALNLYIVQPMKNRLEQTQAQTAMKANDLASAKASTTTIAEFHDKQAQADRLLDEIVRAGNIVRDEGLLFQRISDISTAANVSLERLDPQSQTARKSKKLGAQSLRCSIEAIGSYGAIALFVRNLERDLGITIVRSVHIAPSHAGEHATVLASIETEHFAIDPRAAAPEGDAQ